MLKTGRYRVRVIGILMLYAVFSLASAVAAKTSAGTQIINQAEISWFDTQTGTVNRAYSNVSTVTVAEQYTLLLESDNVRHSQAGLGTNLPHRLINTGNIASAYELRIRYDEGVDSGDLLSGLKLARDNNGNGVRDPGELELLSIPCEPLEDNVSCYKVDVLEPTKNIEFVITDTTPINAVIGDQYKLNIRTFPFEYEEILAESASRLSSTAPRESNEAFRLAIEDTALPQSWVNNDLINIIDGAVLRLTKQAIPSCDEPIIAGQAIGYQIGFTNVGDDLPTTREITLDGEQVSGVILEDILPPNVSLNKDTIPVVAPAQSVAMVQLVGDEIFDSWVSFSNWNGIDEVSKIGQFISANQMKPNQSGRFEFEVVVNQNINAVTIYNQASINLIKGGPAEFESNSVCTSINPRERSADNEGGQPDLSLDAAIKLLTPVIDIKRAITQGNTVPNFYDDDDFETASIYSLENGSGNYNEIRDGVYIELNSSAANKDKDTAEIIIVTVTSGTGDTLQVALLETGPNTGIFRSLHPVRISSTESGQNRSCPARATTPNYSAEEPNCVINSLPNGSLIVQVSISLDSGQAPQVLESSALVEPLGVVFDSAYNTPVAGATVWIRNADGSVALDPVTDLPYEAEVTGEDGYYHYPLLHGGQSYYLDVVPPSQYSFPSVIGESSFDFSRTVNDYSYGKDGYSNVAGSGIFTFNPLSIVDIPLDPELDTDLSVHKTASASEVSVGGSVSYSIRIQNHSKGRLYAVKINDYLPRGFNYVNGSATLNGQTINDPAGAPRPNLVFTNLPFVEGVADGLLDLKEHTLSYRVRLSADAVSSDGINTAQATGRTGTGFIVESNESQAKVKITRDGILQDKGIIFGKVFVDTDCNNTHNDGEWPIGGVKLYLQDGTWAITDANGQYSIYGLEPGNHVIKLDSITLPQGVEFKPTDNRQMADPHSRLVDLIGGEFHRADFVAACPKANRDEVYDEIKARNSGQTDWMLENAQKYDPNKELNNDDLKKVSGFDGDISNGNDLELTRHSRASDNESAKRSLTTGYSIQLQQFTKKALAEKEMLSLSEELKKQAFIHQSGDFFTVRHGFDLDKKSANARMKELKMPKEARVVSTVYEQISDEVADRLETPRGLEVMTSAKVAIKSVTRAQAKKGTWLWPKSDVNLDGRFMAVIPKGLTPKLRINGKVVAKSQLGEQIENRRERAQVVAWYGVQLQPGENKVEVVAKDTFGNERILAIGIFTRPVSAERMVIKMRTNQLPADGGRSYLPVTIKLLDSNGYLARGVNFVTLEASDGQWIERDVQDKVQGRQVRVVNGLRTVHLRSSERAGKIRVRTSDGSMRADTEITQFTPVRPLIAAGILEVGGSRFNRGSNSPDSDIEDDFEANAAFFMRGRTRGNMNLTMSVDTDKSDDAQLFRDINPNTSYPIHGDSSQRGYEAQSRSKVYAKLEKERDSVMWGDFVTDSQSINEDVTRVQRTLTGANLVTQGRLIEAQLFISEQNEENVVELIRGKGVALNYKLTSAPVVINSETIEIITISRDNPGVVLSTDTLSRFGDYTLDYTTGELSFSETVAINDDEFNPIYIRATYDLDGDGEDYIVAGARLSHEIKPGFKVGMNYTVDQHETDGFEIYGLTLDYKDESGLQARGSIGRMSHNDLTTETGLAGRLYIAREWKDKSMTSITLGRATEGFTNSASGISENREELQIKHKAKVAENITAEIEAIHSKMIDTGVLNQSIGVTADVKVKDWTLKGGARHIEEKDSNGDTDSYQTFIIGAKKPLNIAGRKGTISTEYEQDFNNTDRRRISVSGDLQVHEKVKVYARGERTSSLGSSSDQDTIAVGIKSNFIKSTELFSEYRVRGGIDSRDLETASGVRGTYELSKGLSISPHLEIVNNLDGDGSDSVAASIAFKDARSKSQLSSLRLETRHDDGRNYYGLQADYVKRLNSDWSGIVKDTLRYDSPDSGDDLLDNTFTLGLAYRPRGDNKHHALFYYQNKEERGGDTGDCSTHILSTHQNYELNEDVLISGRLGGKQEDCDGVESGAVVVDGRMTWDLTNRLDVDIHGGVLATDGFDEKSYSLGVGANYLVRKNLQLGIGYNITGFKDEDLDPDNYNDEGLYFGLKYKFDESSLNWLTGEK